MIHLFDDPVQPTSLAFSDDATRSVTLPERPRGVSERFPRAEGPVAAGVSVR